MDEVKKIIHQHLLVKAWVKNPPKEPDVVTAWFRELVKDIGMQICIEPQAKYVNVKGNRGVTSITGIETSHSSIHIWDEYDPALLQLDVYSCSPFRMETVLNKIREFDLVKYIYMVIDRGANNEDESEFKIVDQGRIGF